MTLVELEGGLTASPLGSKIKWCLMLKRMPRTLRPVRPNAGFTAMYQKRIIRMIEEMAASVQHWVMAAYRNQEPEVSDLAADELLASLAYDASPAMALRKIIRALRRRWSRNFDDGAKKLAEWFATNSKQRSDAALKQILKEAGFSVDWKMTRAMNDVMQATIGQQVGLIKSIPERYLGAVENMVMRSVQTGGNLKQLSDDLQNQLGVEKKRARFIARDQNMKATASMTRVRQVEAGIKEAYWVHSSAGKEPRPTHVAASKARVKYDVTKGWYDPAEKRHIFPGELINCRCVSRSVVPGFT